MVYLTPQGQKHTFVNMDYTFSGESACSSSWRKLTLAYHAHAFLLTNALGYLTDSSEPFQDRYSACVCYSHWHCQIGQHSVSESMFIYTVNGIRIRKQIKAFLDSVYISAHFWSILMFNHKKHAPQGSGIHSCCVFNMEILGETKLK